MFLSQFSTNDGAFHNLNNSNKDGVMILIFSIKISVNFYCKGNNCIGTVQEKMAGG